MEVFDQGLGEIIEISLHDAIEFVQGEVNPMVGDPVLRKIIGSYPLGTIPASNLF